MAGQSPDPRATASTVRAEHSMRRALWLAGSVLFVAILCFGCVAADGSAAMNSVSRAGDLALFVRGEEGLPLEGATVSLYADGLRSDLGQTDSLGVLRVGKKALEVGNGVLVICAEGYFCGARPINRSLLEFDEILLGLCPGFVG